jgi:N6-adenosine-specific RNA methylase IME4
MGRSPIRKSGRMTATERQRKWRRKVAREKKLANPRLVEKRERRAAHVRMLGEQQALSGKFGVFVADPPWPWEAYSEETGMDRSPDNHHATMTLEDIAALAIAIAAIAADHAGLWLWVTVPLLPVGLEVMKAWGFKYSTHYVWTKESIGAGYRNRNQHEILLHGVKGNFPAPPESDRKSSLIVVPRGAYSAKPESVLEMIEAQYGPLPKLEMFRRGKARPGWSVWGAEAEP